MLSRRVRLRRGVSLSLFSRPRKRGTDCVFEFFIEIFLFSFFSRQSHQSNAAASPVCTKNDENARDDGNDDGDETNRQMCEE